MSGGLYGLQGLNSAAQEVFRLDQNGIAFTNAASTAFWPFGGGRYYETIWEGNTTLALDGTYTETVDISIGAISQSTFLEIYCLGYTETLTGVSRGASNRKASHVQLYNGPGGFTVNQDMISANTTDATNFNVAASSGKILFSAPDAFTLRLSLTSRSNQDHTNYGEYTIYRYIVWKFKG